MQKSENYTETMRNSAPWFLQLPDDRETDEQEADGEDKDEE